jgi:hypothetical protein
MADEVRNKASPPAIFLHTIFNAFLLNIGVSWYLYAYSTILLMFLAYASAFTTIAILGIEFVTYLASRFRGGKGTYWQQLAITNLYLTPLFLLFIILFMVGFALSALGFDSTFDAYVILPLIVGLIALFMNSRKILAVHKIQSLLPGITYAVAMVVSYIIWMSMLVLLVLGLALG